VKNPPSSGPATEASPKAAPISPMKRPRSRGGTMSAMIACTPIMSPPAPRPWTARKAISSFMVRDQPARAEPTTKTTMANWKTPLRP
jgi:hypothetical protein